MGVYELFFGGGEVLGGIGEERRACEERDVLGVCVDAARDEQVEARAGCVELTRESFAVGRQTHRGLGWCCAAFVGDEFGDGGVSFVANGGDDGNWTLDNCAGDFAVVEAPEVFHGAAASGEENGVDGERRVIA